MNIDFTQQDIKKIKEIAMDRIANELASNINLNLDNFDFDMLISNILIDKIKVTSFKIPQTLEMIDNYFADNVHMIGDDVLDKVYSKIGNVLSKVQIKIEV